MIAERSPQFLREANSTPWLTDIIWSAARKIGPRLGLRERREADRRRSHPVSDGRHPGHRHHRSRLPRLAHRRRHARSDIRAQSADRRRCGPRLARARSKLASRDNEPVRLFNLSKQHHQKRDEDDEGEDGVNDQRPSAFSSERTAWSPVLRPTHRIGSKSAPCRRSRFHTRDISSSV